MADEPIKPSTFTSAAASPPAPFMHDTRDVNAQLLREVQRLEQLTTQRMDGIEKAVAVAHEDLVRVPTDVEKAVGALRELLEAKFTNYASRLEIHLEKFESIQTQFKERDIRIEQTARDSKTAIDAALLAAKEAVSEQNKSSSLAIAKSEAATTKQIDQLALLIAATKDGLLGSIEDIKDRIGRIEALAQGRAEQKNTSRDSTSLWVAVVGLTLAVASFLVGFVLK